MRAIGASTILVACLAACTAGKAPDTIRPRSQVDIHERLADVIVRDGFIHGLRTLRDGIEHYDVINIRVSLDSLKGRHHSLEKLMTDIGRICSHPSYAHLPIRILIGAGDDDDQMYLYAVLATAVKGTANVGLTTVTHSHNEVVITVRHPGGSEFR